MNDFNRCRRKSVMAAPGWPRCSTAVTVTPRKSEKSPPREWHEQHGNGHREISSSDFPNGELYFHGRTGGSFTAEARYPVTGRASIPRSIARSRRSQPRDPTRGPTPKHGNSRPGSPSSQSSPRRIRPVEFPARWAIRARAPPRCPRCAPRLR